MAGTWPGLRDVGAVAQLACLLEVSAPKPGNVSPGCHFGDAHYEDFLASAAAIGAPLGTADQRPLGATVRLSIESTRVWTRANTNLGIVLLFAPIARAALAARATAPDGPDIRAILRRILDETTVDDAREVYAAIRLASPGGLGEAESQDVARDPTEPLLDVMRLAADRDGIAREYATGYAATFEEGAPALRRARADGLDWEAAVVETYLTLLAARPDTHIARRGGAALASRVTGLAAGVLAAGGVRTAAGRRTMAEMDLMLRDERNRSNPGTTADVTAASIFVVLLSGGWRAGGATGARNRQEETDAAAR